MLDPVQPVVQSRFDGPPIEALHDPHERALQLLQKQLKPNELAYRRSLLRGATRFFGLDIHKEYVTLCAVDASLDTVVRMTTLAWTRFPAWIEKNLTPEDAVALEVTTNAWDTIDQLSGHCHSVIAVHPPQVRLITAMPVMTDKRAAEALAMLLACGLLRPVWVPDAHYREWRHLVASRHDHVVSLAITKNRLQSILHKHKIEAPTKKPFAEKLHDWWLALPLSPVEHLTVRQGLESMAFHIAHIAELEHIMARELLADERLPLLIQVPGIGLVGAMTILSAIGPIERFPSDRHLVGYSGLGARVHASGQRYTTGRITKAGRIDLRSAMVTAAHAAKRLNPYWRSEFQQLAARIGRNKATVAIARRLLCSVWHILYRREVDRFGEPSRIAESLLSFIYHELRAGDLPNGETALERVRLMLDQLQIGKELQYAKYGRAALALPPSRQPGAAPEALPEKGGVGGIPARHARRTSLRLLDGRLKPKRSGLKPNNGADGRANHAATKA